MKHKSFNTDSIVELDLKINAFLKENPAIKVLDIQRQVISIERPLYHYYYAFILYI